MPDGSDKACCAARTRANGLWKITCDALNGEPLLGRSVKMRQEGRNTPSPSDAILNCSPLPLALHCSALLLLSTLSRFSLSFKVEIAPFGASALQCYYVAFSTTYEKLHEYDCLNPGSNTGNWVFGKLTLRVQKLLLV